MSHQTMPCAVYRGGTSRGLLFYRHDLPEDWGEAQKILLSSVDAYNTSQINGLGGGTSHTSKVAIVAPSDRPDADIEYTFVQIGVGEPVADAKGTCGNLMSAVGLFAVDEKLLPLRSTDTQAIVRVYDTNIKKILNITVPLQQGRAALSGAYQMPGVVQKGPKIQVDILSPGGGKTGKTLPLGISNLLKIHDHTYTISFADIVNPLVFVQADEFGLTGTEPHAQVAANLPCIEQLLAIRDEVAFRLGFASCTANARQESPAIPRITMVSPPHNYVTTSGQHIRGEDVDILIKMLSLGKLHRTCAASALYGIAAACMIAGTVANKVARPKNSHTSQTIRIGHPDGIAQVRVSLTEDGTDVLSVGMDRTARRIMKGDIDLTVDCM